MAAELSIIIPSYNERDNVGPLVDRLRNALLGIEWEIIYVDDNSPDGTAERVGEEAGRDPRVRCIKRVGRRGLSSASIEGMCSSSAPFCAVMDADLQHDETILPQMLSILKAEGVDIVIGSRYVKGGGLENWSKDRVAVSRHATRFAQAMTGIKVEDPMSGFFMLRRDFFLKGSPRLNGKGFKILLDILLSSPGQFRLKEVPFTFRLRQHGESKLTVRVIFEYFYLVFEKALKRQPWVPWLVALLFMIAAYCVAALATTCPLRR